MVKRATTIRISKDDRGLLFDFDLLNLPFKAKKCIVVHGVAGSVRGKHAHHKTAQFIVCMGGELQYRTTLDGNNWKVGKLEPGGILLHPELEWAEFYFAKPDTWFISFGSEEYDEKDYIRDFEEFKKVVGS